MSFIVFVMLPDSAHADSNTVTVALTQDYILGEVNITEKFMHIIDPSYTAYMPKKAKNPLRMEETWCELINQVFF